MNSGNRFLWRACCGAVVFLTVLCLSPLVLTVGEYDPKLAGIPYTLWSSIVIAILIVAITFVGIAVHPGEDDPEQSSS